MENSEWSWSQMLTKLLKKPEFYSIVRMKKEKPEMRLTLNNLDTVIQQPSLLRVMAAFSIRIILFYKGIFAEIFIN